MVGMRVKSPWIDEAELRARYLFESLGHGDWDALDKKTQDIYFHAVIDLEYQIRSFHPGYRLQDFAQGGHSAKWCEVLDGKDSRTVFDLYFPRHSGLYVKDKWKYHEVHSAEIHWYKTPRPEKQVKITTEEYGTIWISQHQLMNEPELRWLYDLVNESRRYMEYFDKPVE